MWDIQQGPWPLPYRGSSLVRRDAIQSPVLFHGPRLCIHIRNIYACDMKQYDHTQHTKHVTAFPFIYTGDCLGLLELLLDELEIEC